MSRRAQITDAAIATLARAGLRGLTHRAVDRAAGLPEGSASYYYRTRQALLAAMVERLAELDTAELDTPPGPDPAAHAAAAAVLIEQWVTASRDRHIARYELTLEATRRPELRATLAASGAAIRAAAARHLAAAGISDPDRRAATYVDFVDGMLFHQIAGDGTRQLTSADLRDTIGTLLAAVTSADP